jgi:uncharacterized peroxidase-related enzyme
MSRLTPAPRDELGQYEPIFALIEGSMGFVPSSIPTLGHIPELVPAFAGFAGAVMNAGRIDPTLVQLVAHVASSAAGCRYCQAHTATQAAHLGVDADKVAAVWQFETDARFSDAERAALRVARDAAFVPNAVTDEDFAALATHYDQEAIVQIVAVIGLFGFLNRWNDTMATQLEAIPTAFATEHLGPNGWSVGKHA